MRESLFSAYTLFFHATAVIILFSGLCKAYHDYCVIGAGPAGLQMGYFFQKANRSYVIFEKSNISGELNFFFFWFCFCYLAEIIQIITELMIHPKCHSGEHSIQYSIFCFKSTFENHRGLFQTIKKHIITD